MLDQFYWAERMFWLGVAPEPLKRNHLLPDKDDDIGIREATNMLARAIDYALSPEVKARASEIAERLSLEASSSSWFCCFDFYYLWSLDLQCASVSRAIYSDEVIGVQANSRFSEGSGWNVGGGEDPEGSDYLF
ncbi:unnamed protein product [Ilex paraguariensis]|uniref:Uncharacterized protein n=1 Tax=Ilex paraguariensis TaxID=185542 RepID=A0ABC8S2N3_9AQUA